MTKTVTAIIVMVEPLFIGSIQTFTKLIYMTIVKMKIDIECFPRLCYTLNSFKSDEDRKFHS